MASIQEAITGLSQRIDGQQAQKVPPQDSAQYDSTVPPLLHPVNQYHRLYLSLCIVKPRFRMSKIDRYMGIGCPRIHLRLYSTIMRAHGLDEVQMVILFSMSLSGATQRWLLHWIDFKAEARGVSHLIYLPLEEKISQALYGIDEDIAKGLWFESSLTNSKGKKPLGGQRSGDVGAISLVGLRPPRCYQIVGQTSGLYYSPPPQQYRLFRKLTEVGLLTVLAPRSLPQPIPPQFRMDLHYPHSTGDIHFIYFTKPDDRIHMLSWDDYESEPIVVDESYEVDGVISNSQASASFRLVPNTPPLQLTTVGSLIYLCYNIQSLFTLSRDPDETVAQMFDMSLVGSDETPGTSVSALAAPSSPYCMSLMTLYFPYEVNEHGTFAEIGDKVNGVVPYDRYIDEMLAMSMSCIDWIVQPEFSSSFDLFGVSAIEVVEEIQTTPALEFSEDDIVDDDVFVGVTSLVVVESEHVDPPLSFDVLLGFVSRFDDIFDIDDEIVQYDSDDDSSSVSGSSPSDQRVLFTTTDVKIVDFGTTDQPRELRIGLDLSTDERDNLIQLLRSYLNVFALSYEDMSGFDPSIVQHLLPLLPHVRLILMTSKDMEKTSFITKWRLFRLRLNPKKCTFSVTYGKLLDTMTCFIGRLMRWLVLLTEFDIHYVTQKSNRGSIIADHLASLPVFYGKAIDNDFPDEDIAAMTSLSAQNQFVDVLATLASMINIPIDTVIRPLLIESILVLVYCCLIDEAELDDGLPWYHDIYQFMRLDIYPEVATTKDKRALRQLAARFMICGRHCTDDQLMGCYYCA
ncbi:hypothetical protein CK203_014115 [Vitis vinifera]|uniref:Uncharacterized protein n=1 Tax=Vitis vinifera TaxID=29760 RepID=A0A438JHD8_VITVI|nr:hypothetical protein CK203_014115 [Vitis vinifera]